MGKRKRQYLQRILCGILCGAMIAASLIVPDMTAYASSADGMETAAADHDGQSAELPESEGGGVERYLRS